MCQAFEEVAHNNDKIETRRKMNYKSAEVTIASKLRRFHMIKKNILTVLLAAERF